MAKKIGIVIILLVAGLAGYIATRPSAFSVQRSAAVNAPRNVVFAQVTDFHQWAAWSPWEKLDPEMKKTFSGPPSGTGAVYGWSGNDQVGEGRMTITDVKPGEQITIKLEFIKPFPSTNDAIFAFTPTDAGTTVTWTMRGQADFVAKAFSMIKDMDELVGSDFERGLAQLKTVSEAEAKKLQDVVEKGAADATAVPGGAAVPANPTAAPASAPAQPGAEPKN